MNQKKNLFFVIACMVLVLAPISVFGQFHVENQTRSDLNILFENPDFEIKQEMIGATKLDYISTQVPTVTIDVGSPELPFYSSMLEIPNHGTATLEIEVLEEETIKNIHIKPFRENREQALTFDRSVYTKNVFYPSRIAAISEPAVIRNKRVVSINFNPFRYNDSQKTLQVIKKANITVNFDVNTPGVNEVTNTNIKPTKEFDELFAGSILNFTQESTRDDYQNPTILYIYHSSFDGSPVLENLFTWRRQLGWTVYTASTSEAGSSTSAIKAYIQNAYDTWENPPAYVTFVGDGSGSASIPVYQLSTSYSGGGDHYYAQLEGNDELEDIFVGRLSVENLTQLTTVVAKTVIFEKQSTIVDSTHFNRALLIGDTSPSGQSCIITNKYVKEIMSDYNDDFEFSEYYADSFDPSVISNGTSNPFGLNDGVLYFNYRGWIGMEGFGESQINALTNANMPAITVILTCSTGTFYSGTSNTEALLRAGTSANQTGGVCSVGLATSGTHTTFNNCLNGGIFGHIFSEGGWTMGGAVNRGKNYLWQAYHISKPERVQFFSTICNLMGDSSLRVWKEYPNNYQATVIENVPAGANQYSVMADEYGVPFEDAWVTLNIGENYYTGYMNSMGQIFFDIPADATGAGKLTISKEGYFVKQFDVMFGQDAANLNIEDVTIYHNDTEVDFVTPGETYEIDVTAINNGSSDLVNISASLTSFVNGIIVDTPIVDLEDIAATQTGSTTSRFEITIPNTTFDETVPMTVELSTNSESWKRQFNLDMHCPAVQSNELSVANSNFAPGASSDITITLENIGTGDFANGTAVLSSPDSRVTINTDSAVLGALAIGATADVSFNITASNEFLPGNMIPLTVTVNDGDYETFCGMNVQVGIANETDPYGTDAYGYVIYDSYDTEYDECPVYEWIELDPSEGGTGTEVELNDNGANQEKVETVDLPFTFKFYGIEYDQISICSNGWLSFGETEQSTFRNWRIPGPLGASPMVAPFWDDLKQTSGTHTWISHNQGEHYFVVQWENWQNMYSSSALETFQVILYDPDFYGSATGDAPIKIQYKEINNVDATGGNSHGEYATVGIEDHTGTIGLEYTYNNQYPDACHPLEDEFALYITTRIGQLPPFIISELNDVTFEEDHDYTGIDLYSVFKDPNNDELTFTLSESENITLEVDEEGIATLIPAENWNGTEAITVSAQDPYNDTVISESMLVTVTPVNDRPRLLHKFPETSDFVAESNTVAFGVDVEDIDSELTYQWKIDNEVVDGEVSDTLDYVFTESAEYTVKCLASDGSFTVSATWHVEVTTDNEVEYALVNSLSQNIPNPFNPSTSISFSLKNNSRVSMIVYNVKGQKVKTLVSDRLDKGNHTVVWNGNDDNNQKVSSGIYFYRLITDEFQSTRKAIMLK